LASHFLPLVLVHHPRQLFTVELLTGVQLGTISVCFKQVQGRHNSCQGASWEKQFQAAGTYKNLRAWAWSVVL